MIIRLKSLAGQWKVCLIEDGNYIAIYYDRVLSKIG